MTSRCCINPSSEANSGGSCPITWPNHASVSWRTPVLGSWNACSRVVNAASRSSPRVWARRTWAASCSSSEAMRALSDACSCARRLERSLASSDVCRTCSIRLISSRCVLWRSSAMAWRRLASRIVRRRFCPAACCVFSRPTNSLRARATRTSRSRCRPARRAWSSACRFAIASLAERTTPFTISGPTSSRASRSPNSRACISSSWPSCWSARSCS